MALVGTYVALSKPLVAVIPVFALAFLRFAIASVAMLPWTFRAKDEAPLTRTEQRLFFLLSFFGNFLFSICMLSGIALTTATAAGVTLATLPAVVALLSRWFLRETLTLRVWIAIALAVAGIVLLQLARSTEPTSEPGSALTVLLGNLLLFGAVVCEAIYVIISKRLSATRSPLRVSALINLLGLLLIAPLGLWQLASFDVGSLTASLWLLLIFYSLAASLFAVWMWVAGLKARGCESCRRVHGGVADRRHDGRHILPRRSIQLAASRSARVCGYGHFPDQLGAALRRALTEHRCPY